MLALSLDIPESSSKRAGRWMSRTGTSKLPYRTVPLFFHNEFTWRFIPLHKLLTNQTAHAASPQLMSCCLAAAPLSWTDPWELFQVSSRTSWRAGRSGFSTTLQSLQEEPSALGSSIHRALSGRRKRKWAYKIYPRSRIWWNKVVSRTLPGHCFAAFCYKCLQSP